MLKIKIVYLPSGRWCLEMPDGKQSDDASYSERITWEYNSEYTYCGQTAYWGEASVYLVAKEVEFQTVDRSG